jgi:hypothetical protein
MSNVAELDHEPLREDVEYLLDRCRQHDRQLAKIHDDDQSQRQFEHLLERSQQHDLQLAELCDKWLFVTNSLRRQGRQIDALTDGISTLERTVKNLADDVRRIAEKPRPRAAKLGNVLYWLGAGVAVILLFSGIWLFSAVIKAESPEPGAWIVPATLIVLSIVAALIASALRYLLAGR